MHGAPALHACVVVLRRLVAFAGKVIALFDQQPILAAPVVFATLHAHQVPLAVEAVAMEGEGKVPLGEPRLRMVVRFPGPVVPDHHWSAAIFPFADSAVLLKSRLARYGASESLVLVRTMA
jgi:hypothetical protein